MKPIRRPTKQKTRPRSQQREVRARTKTPPGYADVRLNKGEVYMLKYSIKHHAAELRNAAAALTARADNLEACAEHVQKLSEPAP